MKTRKHQGGMSIPAILVILMMVGFFVMCAIRMAPPYFEYLSVKDIVGSIATEADPQTVTIGDIRRRVASMFNTNQIYELDPRDVEVYRKEGKTYIDASYEVRVPVMGRIDAMLRFDDLVYIVGQPNIK